LREIQDDNSRNRAKRQVETGCWWRFMLVCNDEDGKSEFGGKRGLLNTHSGPLGANSRVPLVACSSPTKLWELLIICNTCRAWLQVPRGWCNDCNHVCRVFWQNCNPHFTYVSTGWCMGQSLMKAMFPIGPKRATDLPKQFNTVVCAHVVKVSMM
jgi:hypothetical protein